MTGSQRQHLKQLIDHHRRQKVEEEDRPFKVARCKGCGCEIHGRTAGCRTCNTRWLKRDERADAEVRRRESEARMARKKRQKSTSPCRETIHS